MLLCKSVQKYAFIIWIDLRKRKQERAFSTCSWDDLKSGGDFLHGNSGTAGDAGRGRQCFCQPPLTAWHRALFRKSVCIYTAIFFILFYLLFCSNKNIVVCLYVFF